LATEEALEKAEARVAAAESYVTKITSLLGGTYNICFVAHAATIKCCLMLNVLLLMPVFENVSLTVYVSCCCVVSSNKQLKQDMHTLMGKLKQQQQSSTAVSSFLQFSLCGVLFTTAFIHAHKNVVTLLVLSHIM